MLIFELSLFVFLIFLLAFFRNHIAFLFQGLSLLTFNSAVPGIVAYSLFFLPGVLVHELSHLLIAELIGVRTGSINIFPTEIKPGALRLGYVESEEADPFRQILIGSAPFFVGLVIIFSIAAIGFSKPVVNILLLYLLFSIANTMFVSKEDRRGWWFIPLILIAIVSLFYAFNISLNLSRYESTLVGLLKSLNAALTICFFLDLAGFLGLTFLKSAAQKITHKRLYQKS